MQVKKIPTEVTERLHLWRYLVGPKNSVTTIGPGEVMPDWGGAERNRKLREVDAQAGAVPHSYPSKGGEGSQPKRSPQGLPRMRDGGAICGSLEADTVLGFFYS